MSSTKYSGERTQLAVVGVSRPGPPHESAAAGSKAARLPTAVSTERKDVALTCEADNDGVKTHRRGGRGEGAP